MAGQIFPAIRSEEHTSELQSHSEISYAVFCLKKKTRAFPKFKYYPAVRPFNSSTAYPALKKFSASVAVPYPQSSLLLRLNFFFNDTATTEIYTLSYTLSLHDALPI